MSTNNNFIIISDIRDQLSYAYDDIFGHLLEFDMSYDEAQQIIESKDENGVTIRFTNFDGLNGAVNMRNPDASENIIVVRFNGKSKEISRTSLTAKFGGPISHLYDQFIQRFITRMVKHKYDEVEKFSQTKVEEDNKPKAENTELPTMVSATTYKKESGSPVLQIKFDDKSYYVGPFRKYCFQISDNDKFDGDMGSTRAIGPYADYLKNVPAIAKMEFIRMSAATVIAEFCRGHELMMPIKTKFDWSPDPVFHQFIKDCFNWIWPNEEWPLVF